MEKTAIITDFLSWLYGQDALFKSPYGLTYSLNVNEFPGCETAVTLGTLSRETRSFPASSWLLDEMRQRKGQLWNGATYALDSIEFDRDRACIHCTVGSYFDTVNTCTILEVELERAIAALPTDATHAARYDAMPLRQQLHGDRRGQAALNDAWTGRGRSAAIAISCCAIVNDGMGDRYFVQRRSTEVADGGGQYHIVPSMVFQPVDSDPFSSQNYSLENTILREVAEELFDREEDGRDPLEYSEIADLKALLDQGGAELTISGIAMDLMCLRPEILAVLHVRDRGWFERHGGAIAFSRHEYAAVANDPGWRAIDDEGPFLAGGEFAPGRCVATGAASAILGGCYYANGGCGPSPKLG